MNINLQGTVTKSLIKFSSSEAFINLSSYVCHVWSLKKYKQQKERQHSFQGLLNHFPHFPTLNIFFRPSSTWLLANCRNIHTLPAIFQHCGYNRSGIVSVAGQVSVYLLSEGWGLPAPSQVLLQVLCFKLHCLSVSCSMFYWN